MLHASLPRIREYHFHVYFEDRTRAAAMRLRTQLQEEANTSRMVLRVGPVNDNLVGPHPAKSFEVWCPEESLSSAMSFVMLNRHKLSILFHPLTIKELVDHVDRAMWLGKPLDLRLEALRKELDAVPAQYPELKLGYSASSLPGGNFMPPPPPVPPPAPSAGLARVSADGGGGSGGGGGSSSVGLPQPGPPLHAFGGDTSESALETVKVPSKYRRERFTTDSTLKTLRMVRSEKFPHQPVVRKKASRCALCTRHMIKPCATADERAQAVAVKRTESTSGKSGRGKSGAKKANLFITVGGRSTFECDTCQVPLCMRLRDDGASSCFHVWHAQNDLVDYHQKHWDGPPPPPARGQQG